MKKLVCDQCGSTEIAVEAMVDANTDKVVETYGENKEERSCVHCGRDVSFEEKEFPDEPEEQSKIDKLVENLAYDRTWDEIDFDNNDRDGIDINELRFYQGDDIEETEDFQKLLDSWKFYFRKKIMEVFDEEV